jgi:hypothetical protein
VFDPVSGANCVSMDWVGLRQRQGCRENRFLFDRMDRNWKSPPV